MKEALCFYRNIKVEDARERTTQLEESLELLLKCNRANRERCCTGWVAGANLSESLGVSAPKAGAGTPSAKRSHCAIG